jgi:hypothetical protein
LFFAATWAARLRDGRDFLADVSRRAALSSSARGMAPMRCASVAIGLASPSSSMKAKNEGMVVSFVFPFSPFFPRPGPATFWGSTSFSARPSFHGATCYFGHAGADS